MASDYNFIRKDSERRYGTDIKRIGRMLPTVSVLVNVTLST